VNGRGDAGISNAAAEAVKTNAVTAEICNSCWRRSSRLLLFRLTLIDVGPENERHLPLDHLPPGKLPSRTSAAVPHPNPNPILKPTHTHTHPFNGHFSGTTQVSRYQKGKTNLDSTEARDSEWQWHQLGHMQVCTLLQTDNHTSTPPLKFFTGRMPFLPPNQQRQSTEGKF